MFSCWQCCRQVSAIDSAISVLIVCSIAYVAAASAIPVNACTNASTASEHQPAATGCDGR